jgi:hypothetical protein
MPTANALKLYAADIKNASRPNVGASRARIIAGARPIAVIAGFPHIVEMAGGSDTGPPAPSPRFCTPSANNLRRNSMLVSIATAEARGPYGSINVGNWKGGAFTNDQTGAF